MKKIASYRHLSAAMQNLIAPVGQGLCFHWSCALALDLPGCELVIGDIEGEVGTRMLHAWIEHGGALLAPTVWKTLGHALPLNKAEYYSINKVGPTKRLRYKELAPSLRHIGFPPHALKGRDSKRDNMQSKPFGLWLLDLAGMPFQISPAGAMLPVQA